MIDACLFDIARHCEKKLTKLMKIYEIRFGKIKQDKFVMKTPLLEKKKQLFRKT